MRFYRHNRSLKQRAKLFLVDYGIWLIALLVAAASVIIGYQAYLWIWE